MLWMKLIIKYCVSCWITHILQNDARSVQYQITATTTRTLEPANLLPEIITTACTAYFAKIGQMVKKKTERETNTRTSFTRTLWTLLIITIFSLEKDDEGTVRGLIWGIITRFVRRDWEQSRKSVRTGGLRSRDLQNKQRVLPTGPQRYESSQSGPST